MRDESCATAFNPRYDPGIHNSDLGDERVTVVTQPEPEPEGPPTSFGDYAKPSPLPQEDYLDLETICHLVHDKETIAELHQLALLPCEYYDRLGTILAKL